jgi:phosphoenolpyruvate-protein phosphotransferase (PTS system enzyme I)
MSEQITYSGNAIAPGIVSGPLFLIKKERKNIAPSKIREEQVESEIDRFEKAINNTRIAMRYNRRRAARTFDENVATIFDAHLMILDDEPTFDGVRKMIREEKYLSDFALWKTLETISVSLEAQEDDVFRERAQDVRDVCDKILNHLSGKKVETLSNLEQPSVLVADELDPSDILQVDPEIVLAVALEIGGSTSHAAILTRSLGVPCVVGLKDITRRCVQDDKIIVNGNSGKVVINPTAKESKHYATKEKKYREFVESLRDIKGKKAVTTDNHEVELAANIELPKEVERSVRMGAAGVGLYRTEFLLLTKGGLPSEEEQVKEYKNIVEMLDGKSLVIRTFDLGGDKIFPGSDIPPQSNPFLGYRAIRVALDRPEMLLPQLRAILKVSLIGPVKIMFPMIGSLEELEKGKEILEQAKHELRIEGIDFDEDIQVGMMIEVPSAAIQADLFAEHVDFFSIGTNDLAQFTLAVDRSNDLTAKLHKPYHPAVLHLIDRSVKAAHKNNIWVGICGEFAGDPLATLLLLGLGLDELSCSPGIIPEIKKLIRSCTFEEAKILAEKALKLSTADEVNELLLDFMKHRFKDLPIWFGKK